MKKKTGKRLVVLLAINILAVLCGCGHKENSAPHYDQSEITDLVESELEDKYREVFKVLSVEKKKTGESFYKYFYTGEATADSLNSFEFRIDPNGENLKDNYEGTLYEEAIKADIDTRLSETDMTKEAVEIRYEVNDERHDSYEKYRDSGCVTVRGDFIVNNDKTKEEAAKDVLELLNRFKDVEYNYNFMFKWNGQNVIIPRENSKNISLNDIIEKF